MSNKLNCNKFYDGFANQNDPELVSEAKMLLVKCNFLAGDSATVRETALHSELNLDSIRSCRLYADVLFMLSKFVDIA